MLDLDFGFKGALDISFPFVSSHTPPLVWFLQHLVSAGLLTVELALVLVVLFSFLFFFFPSLSLLDTIPHLQEGGIM
jgi:hypothetical protein